MGHKSRKRNMEGHEKSYNENKVQAWSFSGVSQVAVKNSPANARDTRDLDSIPGSGRSLGGGHGNHSSILARRIPWTEDPGRLQSVRSQRVRHD